jgi:2',3'-cyclic-nucleotide 2'-phosphodiesterase (5'-nucleotidase family)
MVAAPGMALCAPAPRLAQPLDGTKNAVAETNLGDLVADAMRAAVNADFALVQASALQPVTIPAGDLKEDDIRAMIVFADDTITVLQLGGARISDALERSLSMLPYPNKGFLQVSGLKVRFDSEAPPGSRVQSVVVATTNAPLDSAKTYRVAVPESLAKGALGYFRVFNSAPRDRSDITLSQALAQFAAANSPISLRVEGRIRPTQ